VSERVDTEVDQTREAIKEYVDDKIRAFSSDMQQVKKNADEISKINATLEDLQNKRIAGNPNINQPADASNAIVRVNNADQQGTSSSSTDNSVPLLLMVLV
jgi:uncharacterized protein YoxC